MQLSHVFIAAFFMCDEAFPHVSIAFWHPQASFWEPIGLSWGILFGMLEGPVELLGHPLDPKWSQLDQDEGHKNRSWLNWRWPGGLRGSQWIDFGKMFITRSVLCCMLVCFCLPKVFCIMVAASQCSCFS